MHLKKINNITIVYQLLILLNLIIICKANDVNAEYHVNNVEEFLDIISQNDNKTIIIDSVLEGFTENIEIKSFLQQSTLKIRGKNRKKSVIKFEDESNGFIFEDLNSVEIENLTLYGSLNFNNVNKINIHDIDHTGLINVSNSNEKGNVIIKNIKFNSTKKVMSYNSINFNKVVNTVIENSEFKADIGCTDSLISYNGLNYNNTDFTVKGCKFDNQHYASSFFVKGVNFLLISSEFFNGYNINHGYISIYYIF